MNYRGIVVKALVNVGTKSESHRVLLRTQGRDYILRRVDPTANAFDDPMLNALVGKEIVAAGEPLGNAAQNDSTLAITHWEIV
jgi:hypothetical protein